MAEEKNIEGGFFQRFGKALWNFDSFADGCRSVSGVVGLVPAVTVWIPGVNAVSYVACGAVSSGLELAAMGGKAYDQYVKGEDVKWGAEWAQCGVGVGLCWIPGGKVAKVAVGIEKAAAKTALKEGVEIAFKESARPIAEAGEKSVIGKLILTEGHLGVPAAMGGVTTQAMEEASRQVIKNITEVAKQHGVALTSEQVSKIIMWETTKANMATAVGRSGILIGSNLGVAFITATCTELMKPVSTPDSILKSLNEQIPNFQNYSPAEKETALRLFYKISEEKGHVILDKNNNSLSADELVKEVLGDVPSAAQGETPTAINKETKIIVRSEGRG